MKPPIPRKGLQASGAGDAARSHLAAGRPIYYGDPEYPKGIIRMWPNGRRELVSVTSKEGKTVVRALRDIEPESISVFLEGNRLVAILPSGERLTADHGAALADLLFAHGIDVDQVHCRDWHEDESAPGAGQAITIKARLRKLKNTK